MGHKECCDGVNGRMGTISVFCLLNHPAGDLLCNLVEPGNVVL